jgi:hypothetical protein
MCARERLCQSREDPQWHLLQHTVTGCLYKLKDYVQRNVVENNFIGQLFSSEEAVSRGDYVICPVSKLSTKCLPETMSEGFRWEKISEGIRTLRPHDI